MTWEGQDFLNDPLNQRTAKDGLTGRPYGRESLFFQLQKRGGQPPEPRDGTENARC